ncbi:unnamed protein product [Paramecium octaurelia]|uniref:UBC core domain-containing protein n=1 Tax=Paramecium octaurelia TaxID=43137 RepID=A0A8S1YB83_PAROT|nr:unnamed protein product [Paramecium octaurelia]
MQNNNNIDLQGDDQQIDIQQEDYFEGHLLNLQQNQQYIQILELNEDEDPGFLFLLKETNVPELEHAILQDTQMFFEREARLYNYIAKLLYLTEIDTQDAPKLTKLLTLFIEIHEIGQYSEYAQMLQQQHSIGFLIDSDLQMIDLLQNIVLRQETNNSKKDLFFVIGRYLPKFLIFSINPPKPFVTKNQIKSLQNQIVSKINNQLFETNIVTPQKLCLLAFSYLSDPELNYQLYYETICILKQTLESLLESNNTEKSIYSEIRYLIEFFLLFTPNQNLLKCFFKINFHTSLYNSIKICSSAQGIDKETSWFKDSFIIRYMVSLIIKILSSDKVDDEFTDMLYDDFLECLKQKQLDLITKVIIPILNSQQVQLVPVCFHPELSVAESKAQFKTFSENNTKMMAQKLIEQDDESFEKNDYMKQNYYYSQLRMQPIHFIPKTVTGKQLSQLLKENITIQNLREGSINDIKVIKPVTQELSFNSNYKKPLLVSFGQTMGGFVRVVDKLKSREKVSDLLNELSIFCQIEEFQEEIVQSEEFLQYLISLIDKNKQKQIETIYGRLNSLIYSKLVQFFEEKPYLNVVAILKFRILKQIVIKAEYQLYLMKQKQQVDIKRFQYNLGLIVKKQKMNQHVWYRNIKQFQQQKQEDPNIDKLEKNQNDEDSHLEILVKCLLQLLDHQSISITILESIQSSNIINFIIKYLEINLAQLKSSKTFHQIIKLIYCLAQNEMTLKLFITKQKECLFRQMELVNQQLLIGIQTDNDELNENKEFMSLYEYVEGSLYAAKFITIKYLPQNYQYNENPNIIKHQMYRPFMKRLAVEKCKIATDAKYMFSMKDYYQETNNPSQAKMQKLMEEISTIGEILPIEATNSIFIRYDQERMDCMRTIIFGASGTPYAHGAFLYDLYFEEDYPHKPPKIRLATTGYGTVQFNPKLYNCGQVCLDLDSIWGNSWKANDSKIFQLLVSVQSLVMSENVMFNEPGLESQMATPIGEQANRGYCNFIKIQNIRYAMIEQLTNPPRGFEDVIKKSFYLRKELIMKEIELWIEQADLPATYNQQQNYFPYNFQPQLYKQSLIKIYEELKVELEKLKFDIVKDFQVYLREKEISFNVDTLQQQQKQIPRKVMLMPQGLNINEIDVSYNDNLIKKIRFK